MNEENNLEQPQETLGQALKKAPRRRRNEP